jgi:hypothetical protein
MSADKRSVSTDALDTLGTLIGPNEKRDAIHLAVEPVIAGEKLLPGDHIMVERGIAYGTPIGEGLGIVDPFLTVEVKPGQRFWFVMYPRQVHSLRHVWSHPAFPDEVSADEPTESIKEQSEKWIRDFCDSIPLHYDTMMGAAKEYVYDQRHGGYGEYLSFGGLLEGKQVPDEFWYHYEIVTGEKVEEEFRGNFFSCSC